MLSHRPIRDKLYFVLALLLVIVGVLAWSSIHGHYAYRSMVRSIYRRVPELPLANDFNGAVAELRVHWYAVRASESVALGRDEVFDDRLDDARKAFQAYRGRLVDSLTFDYDTPIGDSRQERETTHAIEATLAEITRLKSSSLPIVDRADRISGEIDRLQTLAARLPTFLHETIEASMEAGRDQYRTLIVIGWFTSLTTMSFLAWLVFLFYRWIFRPLRILTKGSRRIAGGQFSYRIHLDTRDEMAELAENMNDMTSRFQEIRNDLDRQVAERTQQVIRGEQLAGVGFLAAGVAHEINNPLASIAGCAESLQRRLGSLVADDHPDCKVVAQYLGMIQKEAFRCKDITEKLLDFSRVGDARRQPVDLRALVSDVVEIVQTLDKYERKQVVVVPGAPLIAVVNGTEMKQVVLNLTANALDSVDDGGRLTIEFVARREEVEVVFTDDGCGMTEEVLEHLFEPFFTRRRSGQGTGLGLSISYRIIADHHGTITAKSAGPGRGSEFRIRLPAAAALSQENGHRNQAA